MCTAQLYSMLLSQILLTLLSLTFIQVMMCSWWLCMNWVTPWEWNIQVTPRPSWLPSTSGWTLRTLSFLKMTVKAFSSFMVKQSISLQLELLNHTIVLFKAGLSLTKAKIIYLQCIYKSLAPSYYFILQSDHLSVKNQISISKLFWFAFQRLFVLDKRICLMNKAN